MATDQDVIREFLVSLGFRIDESGMRKFTNALGVGTGGITTVALTAGKAVAGVALAAEAMVTAFASSMEKLYYASKRTGASVENIQALEYGSRRIGIAAGVAREALEAMSSAVRMNPGLRGLMDSILGHSSAGMDQSKVMLELVQKLSAMPHYAGARFAQMFGMDERTFLMMKDGMPELIRAEQERSELNKRVGLDAQAAAEASKEYANSLRAIQARVEVLGQKLSVELLPYFRQFNGVVEQGLDWLTAFKSEDLDLSSQRKEVDDLKDSFSGLTSVIASAAKSNTANDIFAGIKTGANIASKAVLNTMTGMFLLATGEWKKGFGKIFGGVGGAVSKSKDPMASLHVFDDINAWRDSYNPGGSRSDNSVSHIDRRGDPMAPPKTAASTGTLFSRLESQYGLPAGWLDRVWNRESSRGRRMLSPAGAKGHFGFMDGTARQYGVTDPNDLAQSAAGSAHYYSDLLKKYHGDLQMAAAAYNWGPGKLDKNGLGAAPFETRQYVAALTGSPINHDAGGQGVTIHQKTDIHVNGAGNPAAVAKEVGREQTRTFGDIVRNFGMVAQ